jgi:N-acetylmuramoyl-L-alanine amidase
MPAIALAQSSEVRKTRPIEYAPGQTVVTKSRPAAEEPERPQERSKPKAPEFPVQAKTQIVSPQPPVQVAPAEEAGSDTVTATHAEISGDGELTRFILHLSGRVPYHISKLANPYRIVIDMPEVDFRLPVAAGQQGQGLVRAYRYGLFAPGKARVVIDTTQPVRIHKHGLSTRTEKGARLYLTLAPTDRDTYQADVAPPAAVRPPEPPEETARREASDKPVIVIDPGHGGTDPGALGPGFNEKDVTLPVAHQVRIALEATGRYEVHMTRTTDVFITLPGRVAFSRRKGANLFVSVHANSVARQEVAGIVRGAVVYTLSEEASNRAAQKVAESENSADLLAGVETSIEDINDVDRILTELKWRETAEFSASFRSRLLPRLKRAIPLAREPNPSAAFLVLRQGDTPSVLVELGYISNAKDAQLLISPEWQAQVGQSIAAAINDFFAKPARRP